MPVDDPRILKGWGYAAQCSSELLQAIASAETFEAAKQVIAADCPELVSDRLTVASVVQYARKHYPPPSIEEVTQ